MTKTINPKNLTFREHDQNNTAAIRKGFQTEYPPIVVIEDGGELSILDGHNRAVVAMERGHYLEAVIISAEDYSRLQGLGYDDMEIAYAALVEGGEQDQADCVAEQFGSFGIAKRGLEAWQEL